MALVTAGPMVGQASGRVGSVVFSHNRGGPYVRNGTIPTQVVTPYRALIRAWLAQASGNWALLDEADRKAWASWAASNPIINRLGHSVVLQANAAYVQLNARIASLGGTLLTTPPAIDAPAPPLSLVVTATVGAPDVLSVAYSPDGGAATLYLQLTACVLQSPNITYVRNRLRLLANVGLDLSSPFNALSAFEARFGSLVAGTKIVMTAALLDSETGLLSVPIQDDVIVS